MAKKRGKTNKNNRIVQLIQILTFFWILIGIFTVLLTALSSLPDLKVPYTIRLISYGLSLFLLIFLISIIAKYLLPGIRKALKTKLSKSFFRKIVYFASFLTTIILALFVNESYLRFFATPVYQDTEYFLSKTWSQLDLKLFNRKSGSYLMYDYTLPSDSASIQAHIYSTDGRFDRTIRWHKVISAVETKYQIPKCLIAGLIMQESMGNPLQLNSTNDGGAGLMMFQPGTAQEYGLKTYGNSQKTGRDTEHGLEIYNMLQSESFNYDHIRRKDERFDIEKSIDAGAKFLSNLYLRFGSWDKAISAYNRGTPALIPLNTKHVRLVRTFQRYYCQRAS